MLSPIEYNYVLDTVEILDQTLLPRKKEIVACHDHWQIADSIKTMKIRGAPAIGIAGAFGIFLGLKTFSGSENDIPKYLDSIIETLESTRPTAVNLSWALKRTREAVLRDFEKAEKGKKLESSKKAALREAKSIHSEDVEMCRMIGLYGQEFLLDGQSWLTHCNAGALATGGYGTALGVFRAAKEKGKKFSVFVDETRPLLQGSRLTAWELLEEGINTTVICDNMAGSLMAGGRIQGVVVGADRITSEGYVANKIGTYPLAIMANYHKIPFYVAAPISTFDISLRKGSEIVIEEREYREIAEFNGVQIAPNRVKFFNPAFDVTPPELISAIFTNLGVLRPPFSEAIKKMFKGKPKGSP